MRSFRLAPGDFAVVCAHKTCGTLRILPASGLDKPGEFFQIYRARARLWLYYFKANIAPPLIEFQIPQAVGARKKFKARRRADFFHVCQQQSADSSALKICPHHQFAYICRFFSYPCAYGAEKRACRVPSFEQMALAPFLLQLPKGLP